MGSFSNYIENAVLDHVFKTAVYTPPTNIYVGLFTTSPDDAGGGVEVSGGNYSRVVVNSWSASTTNVDGKAEISNAVEATFPTANADWGSIAAIGIFDDISGGNLIAHSVVTIPKTIYDGDTASFSTDSIIITLD